MTPAVIALASPLPVLAAVVVWSRVAGRRAAARRVAWDRHCEEALRAVAEMPR